MFCKREIFIESNRFLRLDLRLDLQQQIRQRRMSSYISYCVLNATLSPLQVSLGSPQFLSPLPVTARGLISLSRRYHPELVPQSDYSPPELPQSALSTSFSSIDTNSNDFRPRCHLRSVYPGSF